MSSNAPIAVQLASAVEQIPGWSPLDQLLSLFTLAYASADVPGDILEIGSWCGRSAVALGMAARLTGSTHVYCMDLFPEKSDWRRNADGTYSFAVKIGDRVLHAYNEQTVWAEPFQKDIAPVYERFPGGIAEAFQAAMKRNELTDCVKPMKGDMLTFGSAAPNDLKLRMAFVDGDHSYSAVASDIAQIERYLSPGGWICFDDAFSSYSGVDEAIERHILGSGRYSQAQQLTRKFFVARFVGRS
jgi:predicted O-methyltransferase YrrM